MTGIIALYIFMLAAFTGYEVIARVPVILHTPLMSGSNFVHGIVLVGAMVALGAANTPLEKTIGLDVYKRQDCDLAAIGDQQPANPGEHSGPRMRRAIEF